MPHRKTLSLDPTLFSVDNFVEEFRPILQEIFRVLGKDENYVIDHATIGMFHLVMKPNVILNIPTFLEDLLNSQLLNFNLTGCFRFPSLLVYLLLYVHVEKFMHLWLNIMNHHNKKNQLINWIEFVRSQPIYECFSYF